MATSSPRWHQTALISTSCTKLPNCTNLHQLAPNCTKLDQVAPVCTKLQEVAPNCTNLHQVAPTRCSKLHQSHPLVAPNCINRQQVAPVCTSLHPTASLCINLHLPVRTCSYLHQCAPTIGDKTVERLYLNRVISDNKRIYTPSLSPPFKGGIFVVFYR